jgi:chromosome segregation ATPase
LATEDPSKVAETTSTAEVSGAISKEKTGEDAPPSISSLNERISGIEEKLDSTRQALEGRLTTTMATLEERVTRLEAKLDTSVEELKQLLMQVLSNRPDL